MELPAYAALIYDSASGAQLPSGAHFLNSGVSKFRSRVSNLALTVSEALFAHLRWRCPFAHLAQTQGSTPSRFSRSAII